MGPLLGLYLNQGQCCCAGSRLFVQEPVYDEDGREAGREGQDPQGRRPVRPRHRAGPAGRQGPVRQDPRPTSTRARRRGPGASPAASGFGDKGYFIKPTVFADVKDDMAIARTRSSGPVMQVLKFKDIDEVIERANTTDYGLAAAVWTRDIEQGPRHRRPRPRGHRLGQLLRRLRCRRPVRRLQDAAASAASSARRPSTTTPRSRPSPSRSIESS